MIDKVKVYFSSWKTTIPALLAMACAADSAFFNMMPEQWEAKASAFCALMLALGLIAAKDADKTNSKETVAAHKVS